MLQRTSGLTFDDLLAVPEEIRRYELFDGVLVVTPSPAPPHQMIVVRLFRVLDRWAARNGWLAMPGPIGLLRDARNYVEPDVIVLPPDYPHNVDDDAPFTTPPSVVIEVASPSTRRRDQTLKHDWYRQFGVPEYWFVDGSRRAVIVHRLRGDSYETETLIGEAVLTSDQMPRFSVRVAQLFPKAPGDGRPTQ